MQMLALDAGCGSWFSGAQGLDLLAGITAAEFGVGREGQAAGACGGVLPFLAVGHDLGENLFSPRVVVAQGPVAGGQGLVPPGEVMAAALAGGGGFSVGAAGTQGGIEGAEPGQA
jgi:hypothetical protein